jgi:hypothetical protein
MRHRCPKTICWYLAQKKREALSSLSSTTQHDKWAISILHNGIHGLTPKHGCSPEDWVWIFLSLQLSWGLVNLTPAQYTIGSNSITMLPLSSFPLHGEREAFLQERERKEMQGNSNWQGRTTPFISTVLKIRIAT